MNSKITLPIISNFVDFHDLASKTISSIAQQIEELDLHSELDVSIDNDVLKIESGFGIYIINKNSALKEIWLSSPVSGPHHFTYAGQSWLSKSQTNMIDVINQELFVQ
jgi:CyaY protein